MNDDAPSDNRPNTLHYRFSIPWKDEDASFLTPNKVAATAKTEEINNQKAIPINLSLPFGIKMYAIIQKMINFDNNKYSKWNIIE